MSATATRPVPTSLGRHIDLAYPSNRFVVVAAVVGGVLGFVLGDGGAFSDAITAGGAVFLAWAIGREFDPDSSWSAGLAAPVALGLWFAGPPGLAISGAILVATRIVARTTGRSPTLIDMAAVGAFATFTASRPGGIIAAAALGIALIADCALSAEGKRFQYGAGLAVVGASSAVAVVWADTLTSSSLSLGWVVVAGVAIAAATLTPLGPIRSVGDLTGTALTPIRIRLGRLLAAAVAIGYLALAGSAGLASVGPALAAMAAIAGGFAARTRRH